MPKTSVMTFKKENNMVWADRKQSTQQRFHMFDRKYSQKQVKIIDTGSVSRKNLKLTIISHFWT
jgi:hypothetical protein